MTATHDRESQRTGWTASLVHGVERVFVRLFVVLLVLDILCAMGALSWQLTRANEQLVERESLHHAELHSDALATARETYASEVVETARAHGLAVSHDYRERDDAIPLPSTFTMVLASQLSDRASGNTTRHYSPYPFPWRRDVGGLRDEFAHQAWAALNADPTRPYYRIEDQGEDRVLRYATAERLKPECVSCHNAHPDSSKRDWTAGEVSGVFEVSYVVDAVRATGDGALSILLLVGPMTFFAVAGLGAVIVRQRIWTRGLRAKVDEQTRDLIEQGRLLRRAKEYTDRLVDSMNDSLMVIAPDGTITRINPATTQLLGYPDDELIGNRLERVLEGADEWAERGDTAPSLYEYMVSNDVLGQRERTYRTRSGATIPVLFSGAVVQNPDVADEVEALVCVARDITGRKAAEDYVHALLDASPVGILVADQGGTIERVNRTLASNFGYAEQELVGQSVAVLLPDPDRNVSRGRAGMFTPIRVQQAGADGRDLTARRRDGTEFAAHVNLSTTTLQGRMVILGGIIDRTEYHEAETAQRRLETEMARVAGMSEIATGVLHNVGNVVNSVNIAADAILTGAQRSSLGILEKLVGLLGEHGGDPESLHRFLTADPRGKRLFEAMSAVVGRLRQENSEIQSEIRELQEHVRHIITTVSSQQEFARSVAVLEEIEMASFLDKAIALSGTAFSSKNIQVKRQYATLPRVTVDAHKLMQIVVNLLSNARHALTDSGAPHPRIIELRSELDDDSVVISVTDNGVGIPKENLVRIFEHGFTTRKNGHGFGLHISATAAMQLGGTLTAHSAGPGTGATFQITIPLSARAQERRTDGRLRGQTGAAA